MMVRQSVLHDGARRLPRLSRIVTPGRRFIPEVDGLRFIAIGAVVLFHLSGYTLAKHMYSASVRPAEKWLPDLFSIGSYGVQLFFLLSGFLLSTPFAQWRLGLGAKPSLRKYYLRRLTRLEPPYIVLMCFWFLGGLFAFGFGPGLARWPHLLASLVYQHNLIYGTGSAINFAAWSLEIEVQFYCLAPILTLLFSIADKVSRRVTFIAIMVALPLLRSSVPQEVSLRFNSLPMHLEFFIAGFLLADIFLLDAADRSFWWDLLSLAAWPALAALLLWREFPVLVAPLMLAACLGAFRGKVSSRVLSHPIITTIGGMCYSMYLIHYAIISSAGRISSRIPLGSNFIARFSLDALFAVPALLGVTAFIFIFLERPCMDPTWFARLTESLSQRGNRSGCESPVSETS